MPTPLFYFYGPNTPVKKREPKPKVKNEPRLSLFDYLTANDAKKMREKMRAEQEKPAPPPNLNTTAGAADDTKPAAAAASAAKTAGSKEQDEHFTAAQDAQLRELKAAGKSWKEISSALKKTEWLLKKRWKELGKEGEAAVGGVGEGEDGSVGAAAAAGLGDFAALWGALARAESIGKTEEVGRVGWQGKTGRYDPSAGKGKAKKGAEGKAEDGNPCEDAALIASLLREDLEQSWMRIAEKYYRRTGKRVHPDDIKSMILR